MVDDSVSAHLDLVRLDAGLSVRAYVSAAPARPLRWRVVTESRTSGGASNVSQSGVTQGASREPVSSTRLSANSEGSVLLVVFDGDREVARREVDLQSGLRN